MVPEGFTVTTGVTWSNQGSSRAGLVFLHGGGVYQAVNQFGDVIWLRESGLRVLIAEKFRDATGQQVPRKRVCGEMWQGSFSLASWSFHLSALPVSAVEPDCPRLWGV